MKRKSRLFFTRRRRRRPATPAELAHYYEHREIAREQITARVEKWNQQYGFAYNRIAIKNHQRRWGSCSSLGNLNFNYKLILLPPHLLDYVVVHELCHLQELHHGTSFWDTVAVALPHYRELVQELRIIEKKFGTTVRGLTKAQAHYRSRATETDSPLYGTATTPQQ